MEPPVDPEDWTDEEWMAFLRDTEVLPANDGRVYAPKLSSPGAVVLGAAMMGLQKGIYGEVDQPDVVIEASADDDDDGDRIRVDLDPDDPSHSSIEIRGD